MNGMSLIDLAACRKLKEFIALQAHINWCKIPVRYTEIPYQSVSMSTKRKCLTLEDRVKALKMMEAGKSCRSVADEMGVGKTQIQSILKRKREVLEEFEGNGNLQIKRQRKTTEYDEINDLVYKWFLDATSRVVNVSGPLLKVKL